MDNAAVAGSIRIFQLAKELGIRSRMLIEEMKARGLEHLAQDHMRVVPASLAEAIREWSFFGEPLGPPEFTTGAKRPRKVQAGCRDC